MQKSFTCEWENPVVETTAGKLRGFEMNGMYYFRGIQYAECGRYEAPRPVTPWEGIRDAIVYGPVCPPTREVEIHTKDIMLGFRFWPEDEACHYLNVWTQSINSDVKKPVMLWIHGGGYDKGSSIELTCYESEGLCREGDVVVVSLNHRLNFLGYLDLSEFGDDYAHSATLGMADIVMCLQWIKENIAKFGGDPDNITIFGQSGGGGKVKAMMQIPEAAGMFQKAIIQSGVIARHTTDDGKEGNRALARRMVEKLGLTKETIDTIKTLPLSDLRAAWKAASDELREEGVVAMCRPVSNGYYLGEPEVVGFSELCRNTPTMIGTMFGEAILYAYRFYNGAASDEEKLQMVRDHFGDAADELIDLYQKAYPGKSIHNLLYMSSGARLGSEDYAAMKSQHPEAPTYLYEMTYDFAINGGTPAWHSSELPMVFGSCDLVPVFNEPGAQELGRRVLKTWAAFAHNGDPNNDEIPNWQPYTPDRHATMVFDRVCEEKVGFDRALAEAHYATDLDFVIGPKPKK